MPGSKSASGLCTVLKVPGNRRVPSAWYRMWPVPATVFVTVPVPDPGYDLQGACICPTPVRYLYPMRRTATTLAASAAGQSRHPGARLKSGLQAYRPAWDQVCCPQGMAYGQCLLLCPCMCLTHTSCSRGACQQAGTMSGVPVSGVRDVGVDGGRRRRARWSRREWRRDGLWVLVCDGVVV